MDDVVKGFVFVRGVRHYAAVIDGVIWRSESSVDWMYFYRSKTDALLKAGPTVRETFREDDDPKFVLRRDSLAAAGFILRRTWI